MFNYSNRSSNPLLGVARNAEKATVSHSSRTKCLNLLHNMVRSKNRVNLLFALLFLLGICFLRLLFASIHSFLEEGFEASLLVAFPNGVVHELGVQPVPEALLFFLLGGHVHDAGSPFCYRGGTRL